MEQTWRWFGPDDPISLAEVRQTGATGIVTALHGIPNGEVWPVAAIEARKQLIEAAGLSWSVVESVPVHEDIKTRSGNYEQYIANYQATLRNLGACNIDIVCYNFMPVLDWTRTDLTYKQADGSLALRFDRTAYAAFDLYPLQRHGAEQDYSVAEREQARQYFDSLDTAGRQQLQDNIIAGLPGTEAHYSLADFRAALAAYEQVDADTLRLNLRAFVQAIVPAAEQAGVRLAIHPDDPPRPLFGLPRVVSCAEDAQWVLDSAASPINGLTLCTGSYGVSADNDLTAMAQRFASRIHFAHLRSTQRETASPGSFHEADHLAGSADLVSVIKVLVAEELRRERDGGSRLPMRSDHGHAMLDDRKRATRPGYPLIGRMRGLAELRGVEAAWRRQLGGG